MSAEVKVPQLGESVVEGTVGRWLKAEGDPVAAGEPLVELETDKVNVEVPSTIGGTIQSIVKGEGETVAVGDVLALIEENGKAAGNSKESAVAPAAPSLQSGKVEPEAIEPSEETHLSTGAESADDRGNGARATPLARRIAAEHGIDLSELQGSGPGGRVKREDVTSYLEQHAAPAPQTVQREPSGGGQPASPTELAPPSVEVATRREERLRMSRRRRTIAQRLVEAQHTAAMLTTFNEVDMSAIRDVRTRRRDSFRERHGVGLGFMSFFTKAVIGALKAYPRLNAEIQGDDMILKYYYDIGIAVGAEGGLVVPVIRDADRLSFAEIEREIASLADKARNRSLSLSELQGGTFTITNGGTFGSLLSTPILNSPQVGILGMHKIEDRPMAVNGEVVIRPMMYVALSYDHRIVDGSEAVRFLVRVKDLLEDPETLLLEG